MTRRVVGMKSKTKTTALKIRAPIRVLGQSLKFAGGQAELMATKNGSGGGHDTSVCSFGFSVGQNY